MKNACLILLMMSFTLWGCSQWKDQYQGEYKGKKFTFQSKETKGFSSNSFKWRIKLGNYTPVDLDAVNMDWGPPYSTDIYAEKAFIIKNDTIQYINNNFNPNDKFTFSSMLYIPFKDSEDKVGNDYFELINDNWALFDSLFQRWQPAMPVMLGIVQGSKHNFTKEFKGEIRGKKMTLRIENDGRVIYEADDKWRQGSYSGLSSVCMPGKILYLEKNADALTLAEIKRLKNEYGTDPTHYFDFKESQ